ncbi:MAG: ABC transporter ATP-binding protein [Pseudomonadota bacterium]
MSDPILSLRGLTKRFGPVTAADRVDIDLGRGEVLALLGENGAGKTTLMNMLFGQYAPDEGAVLVRDEAGRDVSLPPGDAQAAIDQRIGMVHQHFTLAENLSVLDNVLLGTEPLFSLRRRTDAARTKLKGVMDRSGLHAPLDARVRDLSVGERQRVEILKALYRDARILVLDEPTAVLTPQEADGLFTSLREMTAGGLSVIFISHKLREVLAFSDRIAVLRHGRKTGEMATSDADVDAIVRMMVGEDHVPPERSPPSPGAPVLTMKAVRAREADGRAVDLTFEARAGEILGVAGVSGNGQGLLARIVSGLSPHEDGEMILNGAPATRLTPKAAMEAGIGRIPEDRHHDGVVGEMSVAENMVIERLDDPALQKAGLLRRGAIAAHAKALSAAYDVRGPGPEARAALLSGGNIQKLILARVLEAEPRLILANQPTRGLDVKAAGAVAERLIAARDRGAAVILISEDLDEILSLADRILVMHAGALNAAPSRDRAAIGLAMAGRAAA